MSDQPVADNPPEPTAPATPPEPEPQIGLGGENAGG